MFWGKPNPALLLILLDGAFCVGLFKPKCSPENCRCGETVTITCTLTHPLKEIGLKRSDEVLLNNSTLLIKRKISTDDEKISIEWTEDKVKVIISKVTFSDTLKYYLTLVTAAGDHVQPIIINVSGTCIPKVSINNETNELQCEAESEKNASIVWMDNHRRIYQATWTKEPQQLNSGFKLWSFLKLTEEIMDCIICCSVSYPIHGVYEENESCLPNVSAMTSPSSNTSPSVSAFFILLAVVPIVAALVYLKRTKIRSPFRVVHELFP